MSDLRARRKTLYRGVARIFVNHPNFADVHSEMREIITLGAEEDAPCLHVSGPPGVGKSTLTKRLKSRFPKLEDGAVVRVRGGLTLRTDRHRLLVIDMPPEPTVRTLAQEILKAFGYEDWHRGSEYELGDLVDRFIEASGCPAILIDDAQRAIDRQGVVVSEKLVDWLKARHAKNPVAFILVGLGRLRYLFEADAQIERRWDNELRLEPYRWLRSDQSDDISGQENFIGVLLKFAELSPLPVDLDLEADEVALRFFYVSQGLVGPVKKLFLRAMREALRNPEIAKVDNALLERACGRAFRLRQRGMVNPFSAGFDGRLPPPLEDDYALAVTGNRLPETKKTLQRRVNERLTK